ncbi:hypothetical protein PENTCL1PPCAC_26646 [Pristionchus entomophagus]|uniref:ACB domain-containing protein n=1 Tax=Pristionchus entomophagus TaxID=358040 RepID=A0AAV5UD54_9BILA|nr:hypothetical protein PENTCL1PPCAC_26646 [Pristionchus entomophagus]
MTTDFQKKKAEEAQQQKIRWAAWEKEEIEAEARAREHDAYWERRETDDVNGWRDKDLANAIDKASRAGYTGPHGNFVVPVELKIELDALYHQVTVGDYDGNTVVRCVEEWKALKGMSRIEAQRAFIRATNKMLSRYGWNPPEGWH